MVPISEVKYSDIIEGERFDAEYYRPEYLEVKEKLELAGKVIEIKKLGEIIESIKTSAFYGSIALEYVKKGVPFIRVSNIQSLTVDTSDLVYLPKDLANSLKQVAEFRSGDILITKGGTVGEVGLIPKTIPRCKISRDIIGISLKRKIQPEYILIFLSSKIGKFQLIRGKSQQVQPHLTLRRTKEVMIPIPLEEFQEEIRDIYENAQAHREQANKLLQQAEELLLKSVGIDELELKDEVAFETSFTELERRFDAEYYKPKYYKVQELVKNARFGFKSLSDVTVISDKKMDPTMEPDMRFKYIEIANVNSSSGEIEEYSEFLGHEAPNRARMLVKKGDVLVSSLSGSLDKIALVTDEFDGFLASTGFFILGSNEFLSEVLFLLLRTDLLGNQMERGITGTIMPALSKKEINRLLIPLIPKNEQEKIAQLVKESFKLRGKRKMLIKEAIKKVKGMIEGCLM